MGSPSSTAWTQRLLPDRLGLRHYTKSNGIAVGPGRGSAAGSIVSYASRSRTSTRSLRPPVRRFLNAERVSMPDIDIDFSVRGRERVIRYVTEKYGADQWRRSSP